MIFFIATSSEQIPPEAVPFISVDGSVPGAARTYDHHQTGERINLQAMPFHIPLEGIRGIATTSPDTDAVASAVVAALGGLNQLPERLQNILKAASHRCDHLTPMPNASPETEALGHRLHSYITSELSKRRNTLGSASNAFASVCEELVADFRRPEVLAGIEQSVEGARALIRGIDPVTVDQQQEIDNLIQKNLDRIAGLRGSGSSARRVVIGLLDTTGVDMQSLPLIPLYEKIPDVQLVVRASWWQGVGVEGYRYTVSVNPFHPHPIRDIRPLLLILCALEASLPGNRCVLSYPGRGSENWGGRDVVFGSPWNHPSQIAPLNVVDMAMAFCQNQ